MWRLIFQTDFPHFHHRSLDQPAQHFWPLKFNPNRDVCALEIKTRVILLHFLSPFLAKRPTQLNPRWGECVEGGGGVGEGENTQAARKQRSAEEAINGERCANIFLPPHPNWGRRREYGCYCHCTRSVTSSLNIGYVTKELRPQTLLFRKHSESRRRDWTLLFIGQKHLSRRRNRLQINWHTVVLARRRKKKKKRVQVLQ